MRNAYSKRWGSWRMPASMFRFITYRDAFCLPPCGPMLPNQFPIGRIISWRNARRVRSEAAAQGSLAPGARATAGASRLCAPAVRRVNKMRGSARLMVAIALVLLQLSSAYSKSAALFNSDIEAQKHCPADVVVWVNLPTGIYHFKI